MCLLYRLHKGNYETYCQDQRQQKADYGNNFCKALLQAEYSVIFLPYDNCWPEVVYLDLNRAVNSFVCSSGNKFFSYTSCKECYYSKLFGVCTMPITLAIMLVLYGEITLSN